ncbi:hypothetical protein PMAYCL1PPCAC_28487, partial [Pristionchus mayeri]
SQSLRGNHSTSFDRFPILSHLLHLSLLSLRGSIPVLVILAQFFLDDIGNSQTLQELILLLFLLLRSSFHHWLHLVLLGQLRGGGS